MPSGQWDAEKICTYLLGHDLRNFFGWVDQWVPEVKYTQILPLLGGCISLNASLRLLLLLTTGRFGVVGRIKCVRVAFVSTTLFGTKLGMGCRRTS